MSLEEDAMRFDPDVYAIAQQRAKSAPLDLTPHDFDQLGIVSKKSEADARAAQQQAQLALVAAREEPAPLETKSAAPVVASSSKMVAYYEATTAEETLADYCTRAPQGATPLAYFGSLLTFVKAMNAKNVERNTRLEALEARVLELEAQRAATAKVEV